MSDSSGEADSRPEAGAEPERPISSTPRSRELDFPPIAAFCLITCASALLNLIGPDLFSTLGNPGMSFFAGLCLAELALLSAWAVFGSAPLVVRWPATLLAAMILITCGLAGAGGLSNLQFWGPHFLRVLLVFPVLTLFAQLPYWAVKLLGGVRLTGKFATRGAEAAGPLTIRDLMLGTVLVAVCLGLVQFAGNRRGGGSFGLTAIWTELAVLAGYLAVANVLFLPALWACLTSVPAWKGLVFLFSYAALLGTGTSFVVIASVPASGLNAFGTFGALSGGAAAGMSAGLLLLRASGLRFERPARQAR